MEMELEWDLGLALDLVRELGSARELELGWDLAMVLEMEWALE